jgi:hypothetical protein
LSNTLSTPLPLAGLRMAYQFGNDARRLSLNGSSLGGYALSSPH